MRQVWRPSKSFCAGRDAELPLEAEQVLAERRDEVGLDRVLDDRVPVLLDPLQRVSESQGQTPC